MNRPSSSLISLFFVVFFLGFLPTLPTPAGDRAPSLAQVNQEAPAPTTAEKIAFRKKTIRTMKDQIEATATSVKAGNDGAAQNSFNSALKKWYTFGGTIKRLSAPTYEKIAAELKAVTSLLNQSPRQKKTLLANLETLIRDVGQAVEVSDAND